MSNINNSNNNNNDSFNFFRTTGIVKEVGDTIFVNENVSKAEIVVTDEENSDILAINVYNGKIDQLKDLKVGDSVKVSFFAKSKYNNGRYFSVLNLYKIEKL